MKNKNNNNNDKKYIIIILILIILLLLLFMFIFNRMRYRNIPGNKNPDIYEITIGNSCIKGKDDNLIIDDKTGVKATNSNNNGNSNSNSNSNLDINESNVEVYDDTYDANVLDKIFVDDEKGNYVYQQNLSIFKNAYFDYTNVIAPGVSSTYNFKVHNNSNIKIKYRIEMYESTDFSINLKYRLRKNGEYIKGDQNNWVRLNELLSSFSDLGANRYDNYSLDWKWDYEDGTDYEDTNAGENMTNNYKLNIRFYFEQG